MNDDGLFWVLLFIIMLQISCITSGSSEVFSFSFGGLNDNLLAAGCESKVVTSILYAAFM